MNDPEAAARTAVAAALGISEAEVDTIIADAERWRVEHPEEAAAVEAAAALRRRRCSYSHADGLCVKCCAYGEAGDNGLPAMFAPT